MINLIFTKKTESESLYRFSTPSEKEKKKKSNYPARSFKK